MIVISQSMHQKNGSLAGETDSILYCLITYVDSLWLERCGLFSLRLLIGVARCSY